VIVLQPDAEVSDDQLCVFLDGKGFAKWWLPDGYVRRDAIPRNSTGKFLKTKLREELAGWRP
jgi:fatty-acyl-CoA synthase